MDEWLKYKEEFKEIMRELEELNKSKDKIEESKNTTRGCLIRIEGLKQNTNKAELRIFVANFVRPEYVDYKRGNSYAIIRFENSLMANKFIEGTKNREKVITFGYETIRIMKLNKEDEEDYMVLAEKHKEDFKKYLVTKKKKYND